MVEIPYDKLSAKTLRGIIEEFVLREGTEYGARDFTLEEKINAVKNQLERGEARIVFDPQDETCSLQTAAERGRIR